MKYGPFFGQADVIFSWIFVSLYQKILKKGLDVSNILFNTMLIKNRH